MDTPTLLGAALAFSTAALPIIIVLFIKNNNKTNEMNKSETVNTIALFKAEMENNNLKFKNEIEKVIDNKFTKFRQSLDLDHKKLSVDTLDRISTKLAKLGEKYDKNFLDNLYED